MWIKKFLYNQNIQLIGANQMLNIVIPQKYVIEAKEYANKSKSFTSDRHDFHEGGLDNKQQKMFEGKLGEKAFKVFLENNKIRYIEDHSGYDTADDYDFYFDKKNLKIDVKTRTKAYHIRTLELVEQFEKKPKDIYISVRLIEDSQAQILGWFSKEDMLSCDHVENLGYLNNYVMYDDDLRPIDSLIKYLE